ncbi:endonuclease/exonuclease/phosphatase, putative [Medicago truncatula]|uniref:Endonuclease/exonuclease/phosphatase, putative n=1 Tax=Medicago truncatula TaxID=3880 RepID=G7KTX4_MEDTR|nr:endonuclease/exonuclease/phosphatase, putative [Medicago truncatula]
MDQVYNSVNIRIVPRRNGLYSSSTMLNEKRWIHRFRSRNGVAIIEDKEWKKDILNVKRTGDWIVAHKFVVS